MTLFKINLNNIDLEYNYDLNFLYNSLGIITSNTKETIHTLCNQVDHPTLINPTHLLNFHL